ncbi:MAG: uracil-DNA glycosylase [Candidatus Omnitrophica bacterium]|nr:uracil-DNA glycosylase [Candidatus Omnitrophota bacterium]
MSQFDLFDTTQNKVLDSRSYPEFKETLIASNCDKCELFHSRTNIVVDRGNPESKVLMIGEAPGANEDMQGKAFVGRAGQLLDQMLAELGFETNRDSLIINVVKCRPPENRAPNTEEVNACRPYFKEQLKLLSPKFILLLGAVALKHTLRDKKDFSMKEEVGSFFSHTEFPQAKVMVLYHPAYILRDPRKKPKMTEHLQRFVTEWKKLKG